MRELATRALLSNRDEYAPVSLTWTRVALESEIAAAFDAPALPGEPCERSFQRKELALADLFDRLSLADSRELHRRLTLGLSNDPIAQRFARLVAPRRGRLLTFVANARRRQAQRLSVNGRK